jgi:curli biogenesis system outer membrane secretion channel CsgG
MMLLKRTETCKSETARWALLIVLIFVLSACAAESVSRTSFNRNLLDQESIKKVAVLNFESPEGDPQAGSHMSKLFEMHLLQTGLYQIAERGPVEKILKERGLDKLSAGDPDTLRQVREQTQVDAIVLGSVSQYTRANLGFTARLVSLKSGLVLWSISQTGGRLVRPLSQAADETVQLAVKDLQEKIR